MAGGWWHAGSVEGLPFTSLSRFNLIKNVQQDVARIQMNNGTVLPLLLLLLILTAANALAKCDRRGDWDNTRAACVGGSQPASQPTNRRSCVWQAIS